MDLAQLKATVKNKSGSLNSMSSKPSHNITANKTKHYGAAERTEASPEIDSHINNQLIILLKGTIGNQWGKRVSSIEPSLTLHTDVNPG